MSTLSSFPNIPHLTFEQCDRVFASVRMSRASQAALAGVSRQILWLCASGQEAGPNVTERLSLLAYKVLLWKARGNKYVGKGLKPQEINAMLAYEPKELIEKWSEVYHAEFDAKQQEQ